MHHVVREHESIDSQQKVTKKETEDEVAFCLGTPANSV